MKRLAPIMQDFRFDGQTVIVTGAGGGLGEAYALFFGARGANVVVNDIGSSPKGTGSSHRAADQVVAKIRLSGGNAIGNYDSVEYGDKIVHQAIAAYGRVDILINNAGILRDVAFKNMTDDDWNVVIKVHVKGPFKCSKAVWPYFRKQKFGRIINTTSAAGLFGTFGQCNYAAAKLAQVGLTKSLAKEGSKYNILCNAIAPVAASRMTQTVMPPEVLSRLQPEWVVPLVAYLAHPSTLNESGSIFEVGGGHIAKLRWERAKGVLLKTGPSLTPGAVLRHWNEIHDFVNPEHPSDLADFMSFHSQAQKLAENPRAVFLDFTHQVVLVTGAGAGLGRSYAHLFAKHGASVVVNDLVDADKVVGEIRAMGCNATAVRASVENGEFVVAEALRVYGRIDIIINNAGILRDKAFTNMDDEQWDRVLAVHLHGTYKITRAAWPHLVAQKYGRIVNTCSPSGMYGNFGQANYATAKMGILGFSRALAREGAKYNITVNTIAPNAGTSMTRKIMSEEMVTAFQPEQVAPLVVALCWKNIPSYESGGLYEVGSGWHAQTRWQRSGGHQFVTRPMTPEHVASAWKLICDFDDGRADNPDDSQAGLSRILAGLKPGEEVDGKSRNAYLSAIERAKVAEAPPSQFHYTEKDVILYNISLGASEKELSLVYENSEDFQPIPTFGVVPQFSAKSALDMETVLPNFSPMMLLHGEQYLEIRKYPIPTSGTFISQARLIEVIDKGKSAIVVTGVTTRDAHTGQDIFYNESSVFVRGSGGFGGAAKGNDRGAANANYHPPARPFDAVIEERICPDRAALYRLNGDRNPLHIDPQFSAAGGFERPILHGLCFFGISGKHIMQQFGLFSSIKARFAGSVYPGQTVRTEMWKTGSTVIFQTVVVETGRLCITAAGAQLLHQESSKL